MCLLFTDPSKFKNSFSVCTQQLDFTAKRLTATESIYTHPRAPDLFSMRKGPWLSTARYVFIYERFSIIKDKLSDDSADPEV